MSFELIAHGNIDGKPADKRSKTDPLAYDPLAYNLQSKIRFIDSVQRGNINLLGEKKHILRFLETNGFHKVNGNYDYLMNMTLNDLVIENKNKVLDELDKAKKLYDLPEEILKSIFTDLNCTARWNLCRSTTKLRDLCDPEKNEEHKTKCGRTFNNSLSRFLENIDKGFHLEHAYERNFGEFKFFDEQGIPISGDDGTFLTKVLYEKLKMKINSPLYSDYDDEGYDRDGYGFLQDLKHKLEIPDEEDDSDDLEDYSGSESDE